MPSRSSLPCHHPDHPGASTRALAANAGGNFAPGLLRQESSDFRFSANEHRLIFFARKKRPERLRNFVLFFDQDPVPKQI